MFFNNSLLFCLLYYYFPYMILNEKFIYNKIKFQPFYLKFSCCQKAIILFILLNLLTMLYLSKLTVKNNVTKYKKEVFLRTLPLNNLGIFLHM